MRRAKPLLDRPIPHEFKLNDESFDEQIQFREVIIDMGCGHGDYILEWLPKRSEAFFVGVEISRKRAAKTAERLYKRGYRNFAIFNAKGEDVLRYRFSECSVSEIHVNFPDPWLREKQWKNRILRPSFLIESLRVLKEGGLFEFVTDMENYAADAAKTLEDFPFFENNYDKPYLQNIHESFPTLFYQKMSPLRPINYISFKKAGDVR